MYKGNERMGQKKRNGGNLSKYKENRRIGIQK
jgi:hypothetical protein